MVILAVETPPPAVATPDQTMYAATIFGRVPAQLQSVVTTGIAVRVDILAASVEVVLLARNHRVDALLVMKLFKWNPAGQSH